MYKNLTVRVMESIMLAWAWGPVSDRMEDKDRVYLKDISLATTQIMNYQNKISSRKLAHTMKTYLNLNTIRATDGIPQYKGTYYVNMPLVYPQVKSLCERWSVEWKQRGSVKRPV